MTLLHDLTINTRRAEQALLRALLLPLTLSVMLLSLARPVCAGEVEIIDVQAELQGADSKRAEHQLWRFKVTLRHADSGWEHYADGWQVVDQQDNVLGDRVLHHPHVNEQPFTRGLSGVSLPVSTQNVMIRAHDSVHGWTEQRFTVMLDKE